MDEKDKIIASLRKQLQDALSKNRALEQEVALLDFQAMSRYGYDRQISNVSPVVSPNEKTH